MGTLVVTPGINMTNNAGGKAYRMDGKLQMSTTYATGGDTTTALAFGVGILDQVTLAEGALNGTTQSVILAPNYPTTNGYNATIKVQAFWVNTASTTGGYLVEVTAGTNLSAITVGYMAYGA